MTISELYEARQELADRVKEANRERANRKAEWLQVCKLAISNNVTYGITWKTGSTSCSGGTISCNGVSYENVIPTKEALEEIKVVVFKSMEKYKEA